MRAREVVTISDGVAEASIVPELGAGLAWYDLLVGGRREPIFRRCGKPEQAQPFDLAHNVLAPWSNRISGGGFVFRGEFHQLEPNLPGEPSPIHGNAFSSTWKIERKYSAEAILSFESQGPGPFRYSAGVNYALADGALTIRPQVRNCGHKALPFGLGLHPWLPRTRRTLLQAQADRVVRKHPTKTAFRISA